MVYSSTFSGDNPLFIHDRAGIIVTHDLRVCKFVDKVIQMRDGRIVRIIEDADEIAEMAGLYKVSRDQLAAYPYVNRSFNIYVYGASTAVINII